VTNLGDEESTGQRESRRVFGVHRLPFGVWRARAPTRSAARSSNREVAITDEGAQS
jgi:hypothetical protein